MWKAEIIEAIIKQENIPESAKTIAQEFASESYAPDELDVNGRAAMLATSGIVARKFMLPRIGFAATVHVPDIQKLEIGLDDEIGGTPVEFDTIRLVCSNWLLTYNYGLSRCATYFCEEDAKYYIMQMYFADRKLYKTGRDDWNIVDGILEVDKSCEYQTWHQGYLTAFFHDYYENSQPREYMQKQLMQALYRIYTVNYALSTRHIDVKLGCSYEVS